MERQEDIHRIISAYAEFVGTKEKCSETPEDSINPEDNYLENFKQEDFTQQFSNNVVARQIPGYRDFRKRHATLLRLLAFNNMKILDIGSSAGDSALDMIYALSSFDDIAHNYHPALQMGFQYDLLDVSESFNKKAKEDIEKTLKILSLSDKYQDKPMDIRINTILHEAVDYMYNFCPYNKYDIIICSLTAQFIPIMHRQKLYQGIFNALRPGGYFILTEKTLQNSVQADSIFTDLYHEEKSRLGMSDKAIQNKYDSLPQFLHPLTVKANEEMFQQAGFPTSDIVWKNLSFATFLMQKPS